MTIYDLIYSIGYGVAFMIAFCGIPKMVTRKLEDDDAIPCLMVCMVVGLLSWGVPIWWLGYHFIYKAKDKKV